MSETNRDTVTMAQAARRLTTIIDEFRKLNGEMQVQQMVVFLAVMAKPDSTMRELENSTGIGSSSMSRNIAALSEFHRKGTPGLNLIKSVEDPMDRRFKRVSLTPKGLLVTKALHKAIEGTI